MANQVWDDLKFSGTLKRIRLRSDRVRFGPAPEPGEEVSQRLTLNDRGQVWFSGLDPQGRTIKYRRFTVDTLAVKLIFKALEDRFAENGSEELCTDAGSWELEMTSDNGRTCCYSGPLVRGLRYEDVDLSELLRNGLEMEDLFAFDGNDLEDRVERIQVEYFRIRRVPVENQFYIWAYEEQVTVDRNRQAVVLSQKAGEGCRITHTYEVEDGVGNFLDSLDPKTLFSELPPRPEELVELRGELRSYRITVKFRRAPDRVLEGSYDRWGLPRDFAAFADRVVEFVRLYGVCEMLAPAVYGLDRQKKSIYIFCSVEFPWGDRPYYYLADDNDFRVGDRVVVPVGPEDQHRAARISAIQYFTAEEAPMPVEQVKHIIRRLPRMQEEES